MTRNVQNAPSGVGAIRRHTDALEVDDDAPQSSTHCASGEHPICKLSPEVLGDIFAQCLPHSPVAISSRDCPLLLLQVCRLWRQVAFGTPVLWTTLEFVHFKLNTLAIVRMWLHHSGSLPVKIILPSSERPGELEAAELEAVVELLLTNFHRILELTGIFTGVRFSRQLLRHTLPLTAPYLRRLVIEDWLDAPVAELKGCLHVPRLQHLHLKEALLIIPLLSLNPQHIRTLCLSPGEVDYCSPSFLDTLPLCSNLERLEFFIYDEMVPSIFDIPAKITLPRLRVLWVEVLGEPSSFFQALDVPVLEHFTLANEAFAQDMTVWTSVQSPLRGAALRSLTLNNFTVNAESTGPWISSLTSLESLTMEGCAVTADIMQFLTPRSSTPWICPRLSTLVFRHIYHPNLPWDAATELLRCRAPVEPHFPAEDYLRDILFEHCRGSEEYHRTAWRGMMERSGGLLKVTLITLECH